MRWDLFCHVIDNFGDIGVCWRLARQLAERGQTVRLWADDASALRWMAPGGCAGVTVAPWPTRQDRSDAGYWQPGDVVVEAFGCTLPEAVVRAMAKAERPPVWINLEYLSAERYAQASHGLCSPVLAGPGAGLGKWFYFPGFSAGTGGLLREPDLLARQAALDRTAWLAGIGCAPRADERVVSLFCYSNANVAALIDQLVARPTLLLATAGHASELVLAALGPELVRGPLRAVRLPWLSQTDYDHLLWCADINFVRGEDSLVRALWAGKPWVWQAYVQDGGAHADKVEALLDVLGLEESPTETLWNVAKLWRWWNHIPGGATVLPNTSVWSELSLRGRDRLIQTDDLAHGLLQFCAQQR